MSSMLLIIESNKFPAFFMLLAALHVSLSPFDSFRIISFMPKIAFIGVLISCEVLAKKLLFALAAVLARFIDASVAIRAAIVSD